MERDAHGVLLSGVPEGVSEVDLWDALGMLLGFVSVRSMSAATADTAAVYHIEFADHPAAVAALRALDGCALWPGCVVSARLAAKANSTLIHQRKPQHFPHGSDMAMAPQHYESIATALLEAESSSSPDQPSNVVQDVINVLTAQIRGSNPPCATLFIGNVADCASDADLDEAFRPFPGFCKARLGIQDLTSRRRVAFVDFKSPAFSTLAMACMQSALFPAHGAVAGRKPLRIEFAKQRMASYRNTPAPAAGEF